MGKKSKIIIAVVLVVAVFTAVGIIHKKGQNQVPTVAGQTIIPVQVMEVKAGDLSSVNTLTGTVEPGMKTTVGSKVSGRVTGVSVDMGQSVSAGQALATIDSTEIQNQLSQSQAQLQVDQVQLANAKNKATQSQTDYERYKQLFDSGAISQQQLEQSKLTMENDQGTIKLYQSTQAKDQANVAYYQKQLSETTITAPVSGVISARNIEVGMMLTSQAAAFDLVQPDPVKVTVNVPEQYITQVRQGTGAAITLDQLEGKTFTGQVARVSPDINAASQAYPVEIEIKNSGKAILPGMTARVVFTGLTTQSGIVVPAQAVVETSQGSEVFTVENGTAKMHIVELGAVSSDQIVILSGLKAGEKLVINGQTLLSDGEKVNVVQDASKAGANGLIDQIKQGAAK